MKYLNQFKIYFRGNDENKEIKCLGGNMHADFNLNEKAWVIEWH